MSCFVTITMMVENGGFDRGDTSDKTEIRTIWLSRVPTVDEYVTIEEDTGKLSYYQVIGVQHFSKSRGPKKSTEPAASITVSHLYSSHLQTQSPQN